MKRKLMLLLVVVSTFATAQQNIQSSEVQNNLILNSPVKEDSLYSEKLILVKEGTVFSPSKNYTLIAGEKIVLNQGTFSAPEKGFKHQFMVQSANPVSDKPTDNAKPAASNLPGERNLIPSINDKTIESQGRKSFRANTLRNLLVEPNPGNGIFNVMLQSVSPDIKRMTVFNCMGEIVLAASFSGTEKYKLDITTEPAGIYFIIIYDDSVVYQGKIINE